jgi:hypothetical protein
MQMQFPVNFEMWQMIVGALLPGIVAFFKNLGWPDWVKVVILFVLAAAASAVEIFFAGEFTAGAWGTNLLKTAFWATITYAWVWRPTGADNKIARSVGPGRVRAVGKLGLVLLVAVPVVLAGCATQSGWQAYNTANREFTEIAEQYNAYHDLQPADAQAEWQEKFDPVFLRGDQALTDWRNVLDAGEDPAAQKAAFNALKTEIIMILFELQGD